jgi:hypothetical protein
MRGRLPLRISIGAFVLAVLAFVLGGIAASNTHHAVDKFQRITPVTVGQTPFGDGLARYSVGSLYFAKAGGYVVYYEGSDLTNSFIPAFKVYLHTPSGSTMEVTTSYGNLADNRVKSLTYDFDGHKGAARFQFHLSAPGTYQALVEVPTTARPGTDIAFGPSIGKRTGISAAFVLGGALLLILAIVLLIIGLVKRSRHKKQLLQPAYYAGYPPPPGGYAPPLGYQPPGGAGYQPPGGAGYQPPGGAGYQPPGGAGYQPPGGPSYPTADPQNGYPTPAPGYQAPPSYQQPAIVQAPVDEPPPTAEAPNAARCPEHPEV